MFLISIVLSLFIFYPTVNRLVGLSRVSELYSHIQLMPLLSGCFFYYKRKSIFSEVEYSLALGPGLIAAGGVLYVTISLTRGANYHNNNDHLSLLTFAAVIVLIGVFTLFYGVKALRCAVFPFILFFFVIPLPNLITNVSVHLLQKGSAEVVALFFSLLKVPVVRDGYVFAFPQLSIEVAEQCSGIRSSIALVITTIIAGNLFLLSGWTRIALVASIVPVAILKNGVRIVTLSLLGAYFDEGILQGDLHRKGGVLFFIFALILMWGLVALLRKADKQYVVKK
ncbi:MAG: exosortase/archaeosortase family protein [Syntrophobacterales bacterium]|nr:exosortase/archaeosortase family protein [Syntrophobacterales bacterium]